MRVLLTGMGGELGTRVTNLLEADDSIEAIVGVDIGPPRGRIPRAEFHRVDPRDRARTVAVVRDLEPTAVVHLGVYEPGARVAARTAAAMTHASALVALGAAAQCPSLDRVVVRSGIEVYGRPRGGAQRPDETVHPEPTTPWGRTLLDVEDMAAQAAVAADVPVTILRFAPVVGPHIPTPLGRYLRLPAVPVSAVTDPPFSLLHQEDAAAAVVRALAAGIDGTVNVVGPGAVTPFQAVRLGGRIPLPTVGLGWRAARAGCALVGAPLPAHVIELLTRGRGADGALGEEALGLAPARSTVDVVHDLYEWAEIVHLAVDHRSAA
ncbi:NAD-dependent epimerase/dehydratase family protein [Iamia sp. SCSIO 61187]|uniref:NAD-dependent epimerase/dehydratase family protein n=1 Tax=Iamia sp. SCSIO 61187 TaxID=2722752 RepID=UPI001C624B93|nr:NAD-dependent epimerase/dehydratase family protein [Iamia sp. SCSIO 61187]QYG91622.1 NAD-dependent epimerase/dehydratase family protein [Iamia sp. SCSIO 61187]